MNHHVWLAMLLSCAWSLSNALHTRNVRSLPAETRRCISRPGNGERKFVAVSIYSSFSYPSFYLYIVTCDEAATVTVTSSYSSYSNTVHISKHSSSLVTLDYKYMLSESSAASKAVLVTSNVDVSVFAYQHYSGNGDATALLPLEDLGTEYFIFTPLSGGSYHQFAVVNGLQKNVQVNVTVQGSIPYGGVTYSSGDMISLVLGSQQAIGFYSSGDLTGTRVTSEAPVAVFSGHSYYAGVSSSYDSIFEQLHPVKNWGTTFAVFPLFNHTRDIVDIIAAESDTVVKVKSLGTTTEYSLQSGNHKRLNLYNEITVNSSKPVMISYIFQDVKQNSFVSSYDAFFTTVPPLLVGRNYYQFYTTSIYYSFLVIISHTSTMSGFYFDQKPLSSYSHSVKEIDGFRAWEISLGKNDGIHEIYHKYFTFTIYVYGVGSSTSYGYSMGQEAHYPVVASLQCLSHGGEYILPYSLVSAADLSASDIHLEDSQCKAEPKGKAVLMRIPFNRCGSTIEHDKNGKTFFRNTIYGTIPKTNVSRIKISVLCEMQSNQTVALNLLPQVNSFISRGQYNVSLRLYESDSFTNPITEFPLEIDLHSILYVELALESEEKDAQIFTKNMKSSASLDDTKNNYNVIEDGCLEDSTLQTYPTPDSRLQRFSFHVFRFEDLAGVFLSCDVVVCYNGTFPNRCTQGCLSSRRKRDVSSSQQAEGFTRLTAGPISVRRTRSSELLSPFFLATVCIVGVLAVMGLVAQRIYYKKQQNFRNTETSDY